MHVTNRGIDDSNWSVITYANHLRLSEHMNQDQAIEVTVEVDLEKKSQVP
jgi:hypothetical protein